MNQKLTEEHVRRGAAVYVRQSTPGQVVEHTESKRRQYALVERARAFGFGSIEVIDDDLGRSGSGLVRRPGFQRLMAMVCTGELGAVFSIDASRLARNGRDWHQLVDLCSLVGTLVVDADGVYDPRLTNDRLLLGLKGTMSEYELALLKQRSIEARNSKASRGELQFQLPAGLHWDELGRIEITPDERIAECVRLVFRKFTEYGSIRQVFLWMSDEGLQVPVRRRKGVSGIEWRPARYHNILSILTNPHYAGAYAFGRRRTQTKVVDGRAVKTTGHQIPREEWQVLIQDHHPGYITWDEYTRNMSIIADNAHIKKRAAKKAGRGGRALLTGMIRCGRCGHMLHVFYASRSTQAHRYICRGSQNRRTGECIGLGGIRVDKAIGKQIVRALHPVALEASLAACELQQGERRDVSVAIQRELEEAKYEASLAERRHLAVDPDKRLVARELESRWERQLEHVTELEVKLRQLEAEAEDTKDIDRESMLALSKDLPWVWNSNATDGKTRQRIAQLLMREIVANVSEDGRETVLVVHWAGGRHSEVRIRRNRRDPEADTGPAPVEAIRKMGGRWPDQVVAVALNRARSKHQSGGTWTTLRVRELREQLKIPAYDAERPREQTVTAEEASVRLGICIGSVHKLIREGALTATQVMKYAPWEIPVAALTSEVAIQGIQAIKDRRPRNYPKIDVQRSIYLPGFDEEDA